MSANRMINVLVTAIGGGGHGDQVLKALRLAPPGRYRIFGADANPQCPQAKAVERFVALPLASSPNYLEALLRECKALRADVLIHGCEPELRVFSENRSQIEAEGIFLPINPTQLIRDCMDKSRTNAMLAALGFEPPRFRELNGFEHIEAIDWFPVVVKPSVGGGGSLNVFIAQNRAELRSLCDFLGLGVHSSGFMVQEYVGTPESEFTVGVLHDMDGQYLNSISLRRYLVGGLHVRTVVPNRTKRHSLGPRLVVSSGVSHGEIGRHADVTSQCKSIAAAIGARGPLNIQCRVEGGRVRVFEINPRFSGTTSIRAMVGYNEPDVLIRRHLLGEEVAPDFGFREAVVLRSLTETIVDQTCGSAT